MIDLNHVREIIDQLDEHVFSLYLHTDNARPENQADRPAWKIEMKNALSQASENTTTTERAINSSKFATGRRFLR